MSAGSIAAANLHRYQRGTHVNPTLMVVLQSSATGAGGNFLYLRAGSGESSFAGHAVNPNMELPFSSDFCWYIYKAPTSKQIGDAYQKTIAALSGSMSTVDAEARAPGLSFQRAMVMANPTKGDVKAGDDVILVSANKKMMGFDAQEGKASLGTCVSGSGCTEYIFTIGKTDGLGFISIGDTITLVAKESRSSIGFPAGTAMQLAGHHGQTGVAPQQTQPFSVMPPWGTIPRPLSLCTGLATCASVNLGPNTTIGNNVSLVNQNVHRGRITIGGKLAGAQGGLLGGSVGTRTSGGTLASYKIDPTTKKTSSWLKQGSHTYELVALFVVLAVIAFGAVWYFTKPEETTDTENDNVESIGNIAHVW
jgi:hypothetical protein